MITIVNNRPAYILMEIIVSIMILSIVGISLLKINSNEKKLYSLATQKLEFSRYISIALNRHSINLHNKNLNLYDLTKDRYNLKNSHLIDFLKNTKIHYNQKYKSMIDFKYNNKNFNILIDKIIVNNKKGTSTFLTLKQ